MYQYQVPMARILLLEDEDSIREGLRLNLEAEAHEVIGVKNGEEAIQCISNEHFDLAILDIMVPKINGLEVAKNIQLHQQQLPFIFLSAKDQAIDKVEGLKLGARDYIGKPFHLEEFLLRVQNVLRMEQKEDAQLHQYSIGTCKIDFKNYTVQTIHGEEVQLTKREASLLKLLVQHKNEVVSRKEILQYVWGYDVYPSTRTIDNFILAFRKYFESNSKKPKHFISVRGVGYKYCD